MDHAQNAVAAAGQARQKLRLEAKVFAASAEQRHADALKLPVQPADRLTKRRWLAGPDVGRQGVAPVAADLVKLLQVRLLAVLGVFAPKLGEAALALGFRPVAGQLGFVRQREKGLRDPVAVGDGFGRDAVIRDDKKSGLLQRLTHGSHGVRAVGRGVQ